MVAAMNERRYTVGQAAALAGTTVRALHHYDRIGLLVPAGRTSAGYRVYGSADLARLREILLLRQLGVSLDEIGDLLGADVASRASALRRRRDALNEELSRGQAVLQAVERELRRLEGDQDMSDEKLFEGFEGFDANRYEEEAQARWGETGAWKESRRRTEGYGPEEWAELKAEARAIMDEAAALMEAGVEPGAPESLVVLDRHRAHVDRWFYPCPPATHARLSELWGADDRFRRNIDRHGEGLTDWLVEVARARDAR